MKTPANRWRLRSIIDRIEAADNERGPDQRGGLIVDLAAIVLWLTVVYLGFVRW